jgi:hypothetical protein
MNRLADELKGKYESVKGKFRRLENFIKNPFSKKEEITVGYDQRRWSTTMIPTQATSAPSRPRVLPSGIPRPKVARPAARGQGNDDHYWDSYAQIRKFTLSLLNDRMLNGIRNPRDYDQR